MSYRINSRAGALGAAPEDVTRTLTLPDDLAPVSLLGAHDEVLRAIERGFPEVRIHVRSTSVSVTGAPSRVDLVVLLISELIDVARAGTPLTADAVERAIGLLDAAAWRCPTGRRMRRLARTRMRI